MKVVNFVLCAVLVQVRGVELNDDFLLPPGGAITKVVLV